MTSHDSSSSSDPKDQKRGLTAFAVFNPYFIIVTCLVVVILGGLSLTLLPKDLLPASNSPAIQILSFYSGMPVEHVEKNLSARFERYTGQAIGVERQESKSLVGVSIVKNFFNAGTDLNTAISQTTSLVMSVLRRLPPGTQPPLILPFDPMAAVPLALVAVGGNKPEKDLYDSARYDVRNSVQSVPGAMAPTVMGGSERQIIAYLDPAKLKKYNFSPLEVIDRITRLETFVPSGNLKLGDIDYQILSNGSVDDIAEIGDFPLRSENGVTVMMNDVGLVKDASKIQTNMVRIDGRPEVYVPLYRQPGANSIQVVDDVKASIEKLKDRLPGIELKVVADQSVFIRHAIDSITDETILGGGLAALMVLFFLGSISATFAIILSLPLSLLFAFLCLKASGQSINAMTLGGLALSIGVLVDNSIVVIENIMHKLDEGLSPLHAALEGASEVALPVLSATLATLVVFFPVVFLSGIINVLFSALAKSVTFAMIGSYLTAMTVIPLFSSRFLKKGEGGLAKKFLNIFLRGLDHIQAVYGWVLNKALRFRVVILVVVLIGLGLGATLYTKIGFELFPRADSGNLQIDLRLATGTRIEKTAEFADKFEKKLREWIPADELSMIISNSGVYYGFPAAFTPNSGTQDVFFNVELTEHRRETSQHYAKIIREHVAKEFPGVEMGIELGGLLTSALNGGLRSPIDVQIEGPKFETSHKLAEDLAQKIKGLKGAVDVRVQQRVDAPQINLQIDRKMAGNLGVTTDEAIKSIVSAVSGSSTFNPAIWVDPKSGVDYLLGVQFPESKITDLKSFQNISITGAKQSRSIPLERIAKISKNVGPSEINHVNLKSVVDVFLDAEGRDIGYLSQDISHLATTMQIPKGYTVEVRGEVAEMKKSITKLAGGFVLAAVLVYLILVVQFRSFGVPVIIMLTVPMGLVGIIVMLALSHTYFSIQAAIGAIFMIGIAVANGVLLIQFIMKKIESGEAVHAAIITGAVARLRPIMMTSLASMLGLIPMAIGVGHGAEANIPLGRAVIGGQLLSTVLTLFIVPILVSLFIRSKREEAAE